MNQIASKVVGSSMTPEQSQILKSILSKFKMSMVGSNDQYIQDSKNFTKQLTEDLLKQGFSLAYVLSKFKQIYTNSNLDEEVRDAERLRDVFLLKPKKQNKKFNIQPTITTQKLQELIEYENDLKNPPLQKSTSLNPAARLQQNLPRPIQQNQVASQMIGQPQQVRLLPQSNQLNNSGMNNLQNKTSNFENPTSNAQKSMPRFNSSGLYNNKSNQNNDSDDGEGGEYKKYGNRFENFKPQKNEGYRNRGQGGYGFARNKYGNNNNRNFEEETQQVQGGTFMTAQETANQNAILKKQKEEGFYNKDNGRYGRNNGNIDFEGVGNPRNGNQSRYGGGGVDDVVNMVHYHTLGKNINMQGQNSQGDSNQQVALNGGGYEDESKQKTGLSKKFKPPGAPGANANSNKNGNAQANEQLKGMEQKLIDQIESEIIQNATVTYWNDIAGLSSAKEAVHESIVWPMLNPKIFKGIRAPPKGLLLFGPPGTGKTMIGRAIACESNSTFFSISASSLTSKYIGEGEKMVKILFKLALVKQPSVIFIDEIDSLLCSRSENENEASRRIKTEFLVQMEGANSKSEERLLLIGATNRPQELDDAVLRRFPKKLYIPLPNIEARMQLINRVIVNEQEEGTRFDVDEHGIQEIAEATKGYSGADMKNLCTEASLIPIRNCSNITNISSSDIRPINKDDFLHALKQVKATVSEKDLKGYLDWNQKSGSYEISEEDINN